MFCSHGTVRRELLLKAGNGCNGFAQEYFRMTADDVIFQFADDFIPKPPVQFQCSPIEGRTADKNIGMLSEEAFLQKTDETGSQTSALKFRTDQQCLNICCKGPLCFDHCKTHYLFILSCKIQVRQWILNE